jgi:hypothetical protein
MQSGQLPSGGFSTISSNGKEYYNFEFDIAMVLTGMTCALG